MCICTICQFETERDDIALSLGAYRCVYLRCYARETGTARPLPRALCHQLDATLAAAR